MSEKYKIHTGYIISILASIIIILISVKWTTIEGLINYITFALTLSSLILAILAIVYSMISNASSINIISTMKNSARYLEDTSKYINESNQKLLREVEQIPHAIKSVDQNVIHTKSLIEEISLARTESSSPENRKISEDLTAEIITNYFSNSSARGLQAIYCAILSYKTEKSFSWDHMSSKIEGFSAYSDYMIAYFIASKALGLFTVTEQSNHWIIVDKVHPYVLENIETALQDKLDKVFETAIRLTEHESGPDENEKKNYRDKIYGTTIEIREYFKQN